MKMKPKKKTNLVTLPTMRQFMKKMRASYTFGEFSHIYPRERLAEVAYNYGAERALIELRFFRRGTKEEINSDMIKSWDITIGVCSKCGRELER